MKNILFLLLVSIWLAFNPAHAQTLSFTVNNKVPCLSDTVMVNDTNYVSGDSITWTVTPNSFQFINGTDQHSIQTEIQLLAPGYYTIQLTKKRAGNTTSVTKDNCLFAGGLLLPFKEDWEHDSTYGNWIIDNPDNSFSWNKYNVTGNGSSVYSYGVNNFNYTAAQTTVQRDGLISPPLNLNGYSSVSLSFKYAYRRLDSSHQDSLAVYISTDCGSSWIHITTFMETQAASPYTYITNSDFNTAFAPFTFVDWCGNINYGACKTLDLSAYGGNVVRMKFENISGNGNNLYIDDINVSGVSNMQPPVANFTASATNICAGAAVSFTDLTTNNPSSWHWSFNPEVVFINGTNAYSQNPEVVFENEGTYTVSLTSSNTKSSSTAIKTNYFIVKPLVVPDINIECDNCSQRLCYGTISNVTAFASSGNGGSLSYHWQINGVNVGTNTNTLSLAFHNNDTIRCILTTNAVCAIKNIDSSQEIITHIDSVPPQPVITQTATDTLTCNLDGVEYEWYMRSGSTFFDLFATTKSCFISSPGYYRVDVRYPGGLCVKSAFLNVTVGGRRPIADFAATSTLVAPYTEIDFLDYSLNDPTGWHWVVPPEAVFLNATHPYSHGANIRFEQEGTYTVTLIVSNSVGSDTMTKTDYIHVSSSVGIGQLKGLTSFRLFPNPATSVVQLEFELPQAEHMVFTLYDIPGKSVIEEKREHSAGIHTVKLNTETLNRGTYYLRIKNQAGQVMTQRPVMLE